MYGLLCLAQGRSSFPAFASFWLLPIQSSNPSIHYCFARSHFWNIDVNSGRLQTSIAGRSNTDQQIQIRWFHTLPALKGRLKGPVDFLLTTHVLADPWKILWRIKNLIKKMRSKQANQTWRRKCTRKIHDNSAFLYLFVFVPFCLINKEG